MLPLAPDWRWLLDRDDSPWYPSMRLFRQTSFDDWQPVLEAVRVALVAKSKRHGGGDLAENRKEPGR